MNISRAQLEGSTHNNTKQYGFPASSNKYSTGLKTGLLLLLKVFIEMLMLRFFQVLKLTM